MTNKLSLSLLCAGIFLFVNPAFAREAHSGVSAASVPTIKDVSTQTHFAKAIEDLPLMPGLELDDGHDILFIFGSNRIAQTTAKGFVDIDGVYYFYQDTLPQLGWTQITARLYERGSELLHVDASSANSDGLTYVTFEVEPR